MKQNLANQQGYRFVLMENIPEPFDIELVWVQNNNMKHFFYKDIE